jgi:hypothetical protein
MLGVRPWWGMRHAPWADGGGHLVEVVEMACGGNDLHGVG